MRQEEARELLRRWSYKPGWRFYIHEDKLNHSLCLTVHVHTVNVETGEPITIDFWADQFCDLLHGEEDFFQWVKRSTHLFEHHEMDEWMKVDGVCLEAPHPERRVRSRHESPY